MRSRPSRDRRAPRDIEPIVRRLRETHVPATPVDLLDRLIPPASGRKTVEWWVGGAAFGTLTLGIAIILGEQPAPSLSGILPDRRNFTTRPDLPTDRDRLHSRSAHRLVTPEYGIAHGPHPTRTVARALTASHAQDAQRQIAKIDDLAFLNATQGGIVPKLPWQPNAVTANLPPMRDDFVAPPTIQLASNSSPEESRRLVREAMVRYRQEAKIVDARLVRNVSLGVKHASMVEVCDELARQTGVHIGAGRNVRDENVTIFVKPRPAREVMREISRVFGFVWEREGEDGNYN